MSNLILSVNAGSSSLKVSLFAPTASGGPYHLVTCSVSSIGSSGTEFKSTLRDVSDEERDTRTVTGHDAALEHILGHLFRTMTSREAITHVCHRVVHGGDYQEHILIDEDALHYLEALIELVPL
jgi:acetate kinase